MKSRYIADTYAWIAYFNNKRFQNIIETEIIETPTVVIAELYKTLNKKSIDEQTIEKIVNFVVNRGLILPLDFETAKKAGIVSEKEKLSLIDAIIYSYLDENANLLTGDEHFKNKKNVIFEKE